MIQQTNVAVLIDSDNISHTYIKSIFSEASHYGMVTLQRIYGDWSNPTEKGWKDALLKYGIFPVQHFSYTKGKNSTDSAMIIDAMDILHLGKVDVFCLVTSDSDFTRLAMRIRETGKEVIGMGMKKTPEPFVMACNNFIYLDEVQQVFQKTEEYENKLHEDSLPHYVEENGISGFEWPCPLVLNQHNIKHCKLDDSASETDKGLIRLLNSTVISCMDSQGWAKVADVASKIKQNNPNFCLKDYGVKKFASLFELFPTHFEVVKKKTPKKEVFVRKKTDFFNISKSHR